MSVRVLLLAATLTNTLAFPLLSDFFSDPAASDDIGFDGVAAGVGCPEHRPLPPIDPIEGLSWLNHVKSLPMPCFEKMNLGWEDIEDADAHRITQLILAGVKSLTLYQNHLGDEGATQIAHALEDSSVTELDMAHNLVADDGAVALAAALPHAPSLRTLRLNSNNMISDRGADAFRAAVLAPSTALQELWLASPRITTEAADALRGAWAQSGRSQARLHV